MGIITGGRIIEGTGLGTPLTNAGAPSAGTSEVWTLTIGGTPTGGTFKLKFGYQVTGSITWSATNATLLGNINVALDAVFGTGNIVASDSSLTAGIGALLLTFSADFGKLAHSDSVAVHTNALTGTSPTLAVEETTPGVSATHRGAPKGAKLVDTTNGVDYINTGTAIAPTWTKTGTQS